MLESYSGTFTDPAAGKEYTLALINQGSDINFAVAGATSAGVIDAAKSSNTFAIGVDSDQNYLAPGHVLTSMVKRVDTQAFDMIKSVEDGTFKGGTVLYYGLKEGGVAAAMDEYNKGLISPRRPEGGGRLQGQGDLRRDRGAELLRPEAGPEGDGHSRRWRRRPRSPTRNRSRSCAGASRRAAPCERPERHVADDGDS